MAEAREGFKYATSLPGDEKFVSMISFKGDVYVCTERSMYKMVDECMVKMAIEMKGDDVAPRDDKIIPYDDETALQIDGKLVNHLGGYLVKRVVVVNDKLVNILMDFDS